MNRYKALFILDSSLGDDDQEKVITRIKSEIEKHEGSTSGETIMGKRSFVRPMQKKEAGIYVDFMIQMDPSKVTTLKARLKLVEGIFRVQITRVSSKPAAESAAQ